MMWELLLHAVFHQLKCCSLPVLILQAIRDALTGEQQQFQKDALISVLHGWQVKPP